jgi:hypothetical protein
MEAAVSERTFRRALIAFAVAGLLSGFAALAMGRGDMARWCWAGGTIPVVAGLLVSMIRDFLAGRLGVDAVAFVSMSGARDRCSCDTHLRELRDGHSVDK